LPLSPNVHVNLALENANRVSRETDHLQQIRKGKKCVVSGYLFVNAWKYFR